MRTVVALSAVSLVLSGALAAPQSPIGRLEGTVKGTLAARPVGGVQVSLVRLESDTSITVSAKVDGRGRFRVDSLPAGHYLVQVSHPTLDSLDVALPTDRLVISDGRTTRSDLILPTGAMLRDMVCPGVALGPEKGVVAGRVVDADTDAPIAGAKVVVAWTAITIDRKKQKIEMERRSGSASTNRLGEYRLCGVPAEQSLEMQVQHKERVGAAMRLSVTRAEGVVVQDFSLSLRFAPTLAGLDSLEQLLAARAAADSSIIADATDAANVGSAAGRPDSTPVELALTGTAILAGTVRTAAGRVVSGAEVRVRDAQSFTSTDDAGKFVLGGLPTGTQVLVVRKLGYAQAEVAVDLRPDARREENVRLGRAVLLDSVRVLAKRPPLAEFEYNRRTNMLGHFLTLGDIQRSQAKKTSDLLSRLGGYVEMGRGRYVKMMAVQPGPPGTVPCRGANVVIDGTELGWDVNDVVPNQIAGIELYKDAASAPLKYAGRADCGVIVIWLRPGPRRRGWHEPKQPATLQYNGYP
ncbi:MAG TPA: carboxypeptidase regulatory-like domain-containing protein [Gemmatimonadaceae bacterium]